MRALVFVTKNMGPGPNVTQGGMFWPKNGYDMSASGTFTELTVKEDAFCTTASKVRILKMGYVGTFNDNKTGSSSPAAHFGNSNITAGINDGAFNPRRRKGTLGHGHGRFAAPRGKCR